MGENYFWSRTHIPVFKINHPKAPLPTYITNSALILLATKTTTAGTILVSGGMCMYLQVGKGFQEGKE